MWLKLMPLVGLVSRFNQARYQKIMNWLLRRAGILVAAPLWVSPKAYFDVSSKGSIEIGDRAVISHWVKILTHDFSLDRAAELLGQLPDPTVEYYRTARVTIGSHVFIGMGALILPGISIGEGAIVGSGAVVTRDVNPHTVVAGNPAREVGQIEDLLEKRRDRYSLQRRRR